MLNYTQLVVFIEVLILLGFAAFTLVLLAFMDTRFTFFRWDSVGVTRFEFLGFH